MKAPSGLSEAVFRSTLQQHLTGSDAVNVRQGSSLVSHATAKHNDEHEDDTVSKTPRVFEAQGCE